jgi:hypothetical protein
MKYLYEKLITEERKKQCIHFFFLEASKFRSSCPFWGLGQGWSGFLFGFVLGGVLREFWVEAVELDGQKNMTGECWGCWISVDRNFDLSSCFVMR